MDFRPTAWSPQLAPKLEGDFAANDRLFHAERWEVSGTGPEDVVVDSDGQIYAGLEDGRIVCFPPSGEPATTIATTGGRPLGIELDGNGGLVICDAQKGLLQLSDRGTLDVLVAAFEGQRLLFVNNAAIARDGTIYFTDSSQRFGIEDFRLDILEHSGTGRLFARQPNGKTELLLDGLQFANGVALDPDEQFLLVAETGSYAIRRVWLKGSRAGQAEMFVENLPGFPDNLSQYDGTFWVAVPSPRNRMLDLLMPRPWLRAVVAQLPEVFHPRVPRFGCVLGLDSSGRVLYNLQDPSGRVAFVTGVRQHGDKLYLGSLQDTAISAFDLTEPIPAD